MDTVNPYVAAMALVEETPSAFGTASYIWGGLALDVYAGCFLRVHHDIDYLTEDLQRDTPDFAGRFTAAGWAARYVDNGDLALAQNGVRIHLGHIEIGERVRWTHNGDGAAGCSLRSPHCPVCSPATPDC